MAFICEKYKEEVEEENASCQHPHDYCQFRAACIINFMGQERQRQERLTKARKLEREK